MKWPGSDGDGGRPQRWIEDVTNQETRATPATDRRRDRSRPAAAVRSDIDGYASVRNEGAGVRASGRAVECGIVASSIARAVQYSIAHRFHVVASSEVTCSGDMLMGRHGRLSWNGT